jgi:hypothetical protein
MKQPTPSTPVSNSEAEALVERVAGSATFEKSQRLRQLLLYLCRSALASPPVPIAEQDIGVNVFGRSPGYDSANDTLARVQVSQLRKKLQLHFAVEGRDERVVIDLPKGSYTPVFLAREIVPPVEREAPPTAEPAPSSVSRRWNWAVVAACAIGIAIVVLLAIDIRTRTTSRAGGTLRRFWSARLAPERPLRIVVSDANAMILSDLMGDHPITLGEYRNRQYPRFLMDQLIPDPTRRQIADHLSGNYFVPLTDARTAAAISTLTEGLHSGTSLVSARDFQFLGTGENLVFLGHRKGNPWMEIFQDGMKFRYVQAQPGRTAAILNQSPAPGEPAEYELGFQTNGYCVIASQPVPGRSESALLIFGTDMTSLEACGTVAVNENRMDELLGKLNGGGVGRETRFEALYRVRILGITPATFEYVTSIVGAPPAAGSRR